jgi:hypothetical protein
MLTIHVKIKLYYSNLHYITLLSLQIYYFLYIYKTNYEKEKGTMGTTNLKYLCNNIINVFPVTVMFQKLLFVAKYSVRKI